MDQNAILLLMASLPGGSSSQSSDLGEVLLSTSSKIPENLRTLSALQASQARARERERRDTSLADELLRLLERRNRVTEAELATVPGVKAILDKLDPEQRSRVVGFETRPPIDTDPQPTK